MLSTSRSKQKPPDQGDGSYRAHIADKLIMGAKWTDETRANHEEYYRLRAERKKVARSQLPTLEKAGLYVPSLERVLELFPNCRRRTAAEWAELFRTDLGGDVFVDITRSLLSLHWPGSDHKSGPTFIPDGREQYQRLQEAFGYERNDALAAQDPAYRLHSRVPKKRL